MNQRSWLRSDELKMRILLCLFFIPVGLTYSQNCPNSNFSANNFNNWSGTTGTVPNNGGTPYDVTGFVIGQHQILNTPGLDPNTGNILSYPPPGSTSVCMLGNNIPGYGAESMSYQITVDQSNRLFIYEYAMVLQAPGHSVNEEPRFIVKITDLNGNLLPGDCSYYETYGSDPNNNFTNLAGIAFSTWQKVAIDLSQYIGQTLKIQFTTLDCGLGGHYGYAYLTATCRPYNLDLAFNCDGTVTLAAPDGFESYLWNPGGYTTQSIQLSLQQGGTYTYSCEMIPNTGLACLEQIDTTFTFQPPLVGTIQDTTVCFGDSIVLSFIPPDSGATYNWIGYNVVNSNLTISPIANSIIVLDYLALNECHTYDTFIVYVAPLPEMVTDQIFSCYLDTFSINPIPNYYTYSWSMNLENYITYQAITSISPIVTIIDSITGCSNVDTLHIIVHPKPYASFSYLCEDFPPKLVSNSIGAISFNWVLNNQNTWGMESGSSISIIDYQNESYEISLIASNEFGCSDTLVSQIRMPLSFYVPNTFTPDGDEFNNEFIPIFSHEPSTDNYLFNIYNRWGELIFSSQSPLVGWDGTYNLDGTKCQDGTYTWTLEYVDLNCDGLKKDTIGHVNLIR
jgi:gliding motility-associated-like protein